MRLRSVLHVVPGLAFAILLAAFVAWVEFLPPKALSERGSEEFHTRLILDDVTVVNPGIRREPHRRVELVGSSLILFNISTGLSDA